MPRVAVPTQSLQGPVDIPAGTYEFRFDGLSPKLSNDGKSVNLRPVLTIINHPDLTGKRLPQINLNTQAGWELRDLCHALGQKLTGAEENEMPGPPDGSDPIIGPDANPTQWTYNPAGPLQGATGKCEVVKTPGWDRVNKREDPTKTQSKIKQFFCKIENCPGAHTADLAR